jgi:hypothetical protein
LLWSFMLASLFSNFCDISPKIFENHDLVNTFIILLFYRCRLLVPLRACARYAQFSSSERSSRALSYFSSNIRTKSPGDRSCCISCSCFACISEFDRATRISVNPFCINIPRRFTLCARWNQSRRIARRDSQRENEAVAEREGNQPRREVSEWGRRSCREKKSSLP